MPEEGGHCVNKAQPRVCDVTRGPIEGPIVGPSTRRRKAKRGIQKVRSQVHDLREHVLYQICQAHMNTVGRGVGDLPHPKKSKEKTHRWGKKKCTG